MRASTRGPTSTSPKEAVCEHLDSLTQMLFRDGVYCEHPVSGESFMVSWIGQTRQSCLVTNPQPRTSLEDLPTRLLHLHNSDHQGYLGSFENSQLTEIPFGIVNAAVAK